MKLGLIIGSTRPGRTGPKVARWLHDAVTEAGEAEPELLDLKEFNLPVFDEPLHPRLGKYSHPHTKAWAEAVGRQDAFVFVTPEYNHLPPASLINAVTFLGPEWNYKPSAFASYGGISGGLRAVQELKLLLLAVKSVPVTESIIIPAVAKQIEGDSFSPNTLQTEGVAAMLQSLKSWSGALESLRG